MDSFDRSVRLTRRTATVTTSAPDAAWQRAISGKLRYLPVPIIRRERKVRPDMVRDMLPVYAAGRGAVDVLTRPRQANCDDQRSGMPLTQNRIAPKNHSVT